MQQVDDRRREALRSARLLVAEAVVRGDENILWSQKENLILLKLYAADSDCRERAQTPSLNGYQTSPNSPNVAASRQQSANRPSR